MKRVLAYSLVVVWGLGFPALTPLRSQEPETPAPKKAPASALIFSGTVTKLTDDSVTVVRKVLGHDAVTRVFTRDANTKVEGTLRESARVTVRYKSAEDGGFSAVYIIVR